MSITSIASRNSQATHITAIQILLPFPTSINVDTEYDWGGEEMGVAADFVKQFSSRSGITTDDLKANLQRSAETIAQAVGGNANSARNALRRRTLNPKEEMLFNGVTFRRFQLNWNLIPTTAAESLAYAQAIEELHKLAAPDLGSSHFFTYPETTKVFVQKEGGAPIIDRGDCAITRISVDLTPDGIWAQLKDGRPVNTALSIDFVELKLPTKDNVPKLIG